MRTPQMPLTIEARHAVVFLVEVETAAQVAARAGADDALMAVAAVAPREAGFDRVRTGDVRGRRREGVAIGHAEVVIDRSACSTASVVVRSLRPTSLGSTLDCASLVE